jgi:hypothetical protein
VYTHPLRLARVSVEPIAMRNVDVSCAKVECSRSTGKNVYRVMMKIELTDCLTTELDGVAKIEKEQWTGTGVFLLRPEDGRWSKG